MAKEFLIVDNVCSANKYLPNPLILGEIVQVIDEEETDNFSKQFVKVFHNEGKDVSKFLRHYFISYEPNNKIELVNLIKNKGRLPDIKK